MSVRRVLTRARMAVRRDISSGEKCFGFPLASLPSACADLFTDVSSVGFEHPKFEQVLGPSILIGSARIAQHDSLAAFGSDSHESVAQLVFVSTGGMLDRLSDLVSSQDALAIGQPFSEPASRPGRVEHAIANISPVRINRRFRGDNSKSPVEFIATNPKLSVERDALRQLIREPVRGEEAVSVSGDKLFAVPDPAHTVKLLTQKPAVDVLPDIPLRQRAKAGFRSLLPGLPIHHFCYRHAKTITAYGNSCNNKVAKSFSWNNKECE